MKQIIFSDIDGTLIDFVTYDYAVVETAVADLIDRQIPLVLCSSKTRAEQQTLRRALLIPDPFIVENGSALFIPQGYFTVEYTAQRQVDAYDVIELGVEAALIQQVLAAVRTQSGLAFETYADLSVAQVAAVTGLDVDAAQRARRRDYSATIVTPLTPEARRKLAAALAVHDLRVVSGGKFHTVTSTHSDKGTAVTHLTRLFQRQFGAVETFGLGDSANDRPLLAAVDRPFLVQKPDGTWEEIALDVTRIAGIGPQGWRQVIQQHLL